MDFCSRMPAEPIQRLLRQVKRTRGSWEEVAQSLGVSSRTLLRIMQADDLSIAVADALAFRVGLHPANIWPTEWQCLDDQSTTKGGRSDGSSETHRSRQATHR